jgi:hypothetical protein
MRPHHLVIWNFPMALDPAAAGSFFFMRLFAVWALFL